MKNKLIFTSFLVSGGIFISIVFVMPVFAYDFNYNPNLDSRIIGKERNLQKSDKKSAVLSFQKDDDLNNTSRVHLIIDPNNQPINAVSLIIHYSKTNLKPILIDNTNSAFSIFLNENINKDDGTITIIYIEPYPGINKKSNIADIIFEKTGEGEALVSYDKDSKVLANDGFGTDVLDQMLDIKF